MIPAPSIWSDQADYRPGATVNLAGTGWGPGETVHIEDGDVYIFAHGKEKKLLGQVAMDQPIKGTPVAVNGVLYVVTDTQLFAIANK